MILKIELLYTWVIVIILFISCSSPKYDTFEVVPEESKSCVADAKQLLIDCRGSKLPLIEQCRSREAMLYQQALSTYNTNKAMLMSQYQQCMSNCLQQTHPSSQDGSPVQNDSSYCAGYNGPCRPLEDGLDSLKPPQQASCDYIEQSCNDEYMLNFKRCGGILEERCVEDCEDEGKK